VVTADTSVIRQRTVRLLPRTVYPLLLSFRMSGLAKHLLMRVRSNTSDELVHDQGALPWISLTRRQPPLTQCPVSVSRDAVGVLPQPGQPAAQEDRGLMRLEYGEKGSIMRHMRSGDVVPHDQASVAPLFVAAGMALVHVYSNA
jgi:hypothetical protein